MKQAVLSARARGVSVRLVTNSLASTDLVASYAAFENSEGLLLGAGVEIWEYSGPQHLHAKSMIVDGAVAVIGSYNADSRSERADLEVAVAIYDPAAAATLDSSIEQRLANAYRVAADGIPAGGGPRHPGAEPEKIRKMRRERAVVPLFRRFL
jgi:phosphatidylserine/phosphatidylglycerophosphate/cardiolipin synthase-like enzyme